ncbi:Serine/threonine-protein kinase 38 [Sporothrix curviconia]|uniref:Serine/threonine-protein kinase 38 n=1 Tax=Sporothrix curviconia TaxID=1260050 RepID=A0ABP0ANQ4_9PEZI
MQWTNATKRPREYFEDRVLGKGAFGKVIRVIEKLTGEVFAKKVINSSYGSRWQEAMTLERLNHPNIVKYVSYLRHHNGTAELLMEYVEGPNLHEVLFGGDSNCQPLSEDEAREILRQILMAAAYLKQENTTHRDLKPGNIILARRHPTILIKIVDLGLATDNIQFHTLCGTQFYLAPEYQVFNTSNSSHDSDDSDSEDTDGILRAAAAIPENDNQGQGREFSGTNKVDIFAIGVIALQLFCFPTGSRGHLTLACGALEHATAMGAIQDNKASFALAHAAGVVCSQQEAQG